MSVLKSSAHSVWRKFDRLNALGEGTYGRVFRARRKADGKIAALKQLTEGGPGDGVGAEVLREVQMLKRCSHENIVSFLGVEGAESGEGGGCIFLVLEYCEHDMATLMDNMSSRFSRADLKSLGLQLLKAVNYLHTEKRIMHRDIKLSNLLLNNRGLLKLGDFGLARNIVRTRIQEERGEKARLEDQGHLKDSTAVNVVDLDLEEHSLRPEPAASSEFPSVQFQGYTTGVVTLWYRCPELLLQLPYDEKVDLWSCGCVLAETLLHEPLLPGRDEEDQLRRTLDLVGDFEELLSLSGGQPVSEAVARALRKSNGLRSRVHLKFENETEAFINLMESLLDPNPKYRISGQEAVAHPYWKERPFPTAPGWMPSFKEHRNELESNSHAGVNIRELKRKLKEREKEKDVKFFRR